MSNDTMIECTNLTKRFGHVTAVDQLDETLRPKTNNEVRTSAGLRQVLAKLQARGAVD